MAINVYFGGTTGAADGTLEVPHDFDTRLDLGNIGSVVTLHFRAADGFRNADSFSVADIPYCEVSKDGTTYATSVTYAAREVVDTNVPLYIKRISGSVAADITQPTSPRLPTITEMIENRAPAAFTPTITDVTTTSATVTFSTTDPDSDTLTYKVAVTESATPPSDWSGYANVTSPLSVTGLTENTTYYAHAQASDGALATVGTSNSFITTATDVTAPIWGEGAAITSTVVSSAQIDLSWPAATDNVAVTGYDIEWGTTLSYGSSSTSATTAFSITGLTSETLYYIRVRPYDAVPNSGAWLTAEATTSAPSWSLNFEDTFIRANSSTVGNGWSENTRSGYVTSGISGNILYHYDTSSPYSALYIYRDSTAPHTRAVQIKHLAQAVNSGAVIPSFFYLWVGRRGQTAPEGTSSGYGYHAKINNYNSTVELYRTDNALPTLLGSTSHTVAQGIYRVERDAISGDIKLMFAPAATPTNFTVLLTANDTTYMTASDANAYGVGMGIQLAASYPQGSFDDFRVFEQGA